MNRRLALAAISIAFAPALAMAQGGPPKPSTDPAAMAAGTYVSDPTHTSVTGVVNHFGFSGYTFRFDKVEASYTYDPKAPEASKITATIDTKSLSTGFDKADKEFPTEFLAADKFPTATFVSTSIKRGAGNKGTVAGDLTLGGVTKPVTLDVTFNGYGPMMAPTNLKAGFTANATIKRTEFGLTKYAPMVGDEVALHIQAEFSPKK